LDRFYDYGIDLGTTNSCVARTTISDVVVFQNLDSMNVTPSAVHIDKRARMFIGRKAHDKLISDPENTAVEFKRFMGVAHTHKFSCGKEMSPVELSAEILKSIREDVFRQTGSLLSDAVITVPASFDTRQCDATIRAGKLAGIDSLILLQEPIAAAVAYGIKPSSKNQNWMVFDFGGGTLDIAIISTFDNRLSVINHEGDNRLGGKDFDSIICDEILLPALKEKYRLTENAAALENIKRRLRAFAEEAKKTLSTCKCACVDIYDIGEDMNGEFIELTVTITAEEFEKITSPLVEKAVGIAKKALENSKIELSSLDKILLVGGTTLIPFVRRSLIEEFGVPLDTSIDPMTVVARGAAIFGSVNKIKNDNSTAEENVEKLTAMVEYPSITCENSANIIGKLINSRKLGVREIRIDDITGIWTSGWLELVNKAKGIFDVDVFLQPESLNFFTISARDASGNILEVENSSFTIRHNENALVVSSPPIPHSICVEKISEGQSCLEVMIKKGTQLPAKAIKKFISNKTLTPGEKDFITVKIWEGENKTISANEWVGNVYIRSEALKRPIPEGFEIEVCITVDESRQLEVSAYVPHIDLVIQDNFLYNSEPLRLDEPVEAITKELTNIIRQLKSKSYLNPEQMFELSTLLRRVKEIETELDSCRELIGIDDERVLGLINEFKELRALIGEFERSISEADETVIELSEISRVETAVTTYGTENDKLLFEELKDEYTQNIEKALKRRAVLERLTSLKTMVMLNNASFLKLALLQLSTPSCSYSDATEALELKGRGQLSLVTGDVRGLQNAVIGLLSLSVDYNSDLFNQKALPPDLR